MQGNCLVPSKLRKFMPRFRGLVCLAWERREGSLESASSSRSFRPASICTTAPLLSLVRPIPSRATLPAAPALQPLLEGCYIQCIFNARANLTVAATAQGRGVANADRSGHV